jgi:hypothetical protein
MLAIVVYAIILQVDFNYPWTWTFFRSLSLGLWCRLFLEGVYSQLSYFWIETDDLTLTRFFRFSLNQHKFALNAVLALAHAHIFHDYFTLLHEVPLHTAKVALGCLVWWSHQEWGPGLTHLSALSTAGLHLCYQDIFEHLGHFCPGHFDC